MKFLIAGLGNPGREYENTRHNIGFKILDALAEPSNIFFNSDRYADKTTTKHKGRTLVLIKPNTFMNDSGKSVAALSNYFKVKPEEILVIHDELDLSPGHTKLKLGGGHGGHNGIKSISSLLQTNNFWRLRLGIGHPGEKNLVNNYVLSKPSKLEKLAIEDTIFNSYKIFSLLTMGDFEKAMLNLHSK